MNTLKYLLSAMTLLVAFGVSAQGDDAGDVQLDPGDDLVTVAISDVPPNVMAAAQAAAPDVFFNTALSYWSDDWRIYRVTGRLFREVWSVYVRSDGKVIRTDSDLQDD